MMRLFTPQLSLTHIAPLA